ncbi:unnamed protein product [Linum trigynum]|uniref:Uncharacterized protein n=1 Tax=Linum trigynum TaxID=586398 RepID=A0AAV2E9Y8_9ROSI
MAEAFEQSRRRRLIFQEEPEEEEETIGDGSNLRAPVGPAEDPSTKLRAHPRLRKGGATCSLNSPHKHAGSTPSGDLLDLEEKDFVALEEPVDVD